MLRASVEWLRVRQNKKELSKALFALIVKPEVDLLDKNVARGGTEWTGLDKYQASFLLTLRWYQNQLVNDLLKDIPEGKWIKDNDTAAKIVLDGAQRQSFLDFHSSDKAIDLLVGKDADETARAHALIVHAYAGNCYFDLHPELFPSQESQ